MNGQGIQYPVGHPVETSVMKGLMLTWCKVCISINYPKTFHLGDKRNIFFGFPKVGFLQFVVKHKNIFINQQSFNVSCKSMHLF